MGRLLSEITGNPASLTIRIVDYPGEWLLDLPLLGQSYADWSRATLRLMRKGVRAEISGEFLAFLGQHRAEEVASEEVAKQAHDLYCAYLINARDRHGLSFLQPGRFLCPGSLGDVPYLWFAPIDVREHGVFAPHTLGALMAERFETYKQEAVAPFYHDHFRNYSRQIVLVDVLRALSRLLRAEGFTDIRYVMTDAGMGQSKMLASGEIVTTDGEGRPVMAVVTTRDEGQDCAVFPGVARGDGTK